MTMHLLGDHPRRERRPLFWASPWFLPQCKKSNAKCKWASCKIERKENPIEGGKRTVVVSFLQSSGLPGKMRTLVLVLVAVALAGGTAAEEGKWETLVNPSASSFLAGEHFAQDLSMSYPPKFAVDRNADTLFKSKRIKKADIWRHYWVCRPGWGV